ncbi:16109_t:CDS:2 [Entrophospora sp. SA101]|nr:7380_t:CDS:2 [Entrophospora sp. SA101]CAJ0761150.1 16109_t:CDS:2 [Entrophospora sp. SA101]CAJ0824744.1 6770_t:CDS:2 [Entrophospora sp. SA101]
MTQINNNLPPYAEELLTRPKKNNWGSTAVLKRKEAEGAITIKNEKEIFLLKPLTKEQGTQTELKSKEIDYLYQQTTSLTKEKNKVRLLINKSQSLREERKKLLAKIKEQANEDILSQQTIINLQEEVAYNSLEDLEQKQAIIQNYLQKIEELENNITSIQNLLGLDDLNNLPQIPQGETLISLLERPTQEQLRKKEGKINE